MLVKIISSVFKGIKAANPRFMSKFEDLKTTPYLYGSDYMKELARDAIKNNDRDSLRLIKWYIEKKHNAGDIGSYKSIVRSINNKLRKLKENIDIDDLF